jgi:hypothetical protein
MGLHSSGIKPSSRESAHHNIELSCAAESPARSEPRQPAPPRTTLHSGVSFNDLLEFTRRLRISPSATLRASCPRARSQDGEGAPLQGCPFQPTPGRICSGALRGACQPPATEAVHPSNDSPTKGSQSYLNCGAQLPQSIRAYAALRSPSPGQAPPLPS